MIYNVVLVLGAEQSDSVIHKTAQGTILNILYSLFIGET